MSQETRQKSKLRQTLKVRYTFVINQRQQLFKQRKQNVRLNVIEMEKMQKEMVKIFQDYQIEEGYTRPYFLMYQRLTMQRKYQVLQMDLSIYRQFFFKIEKFLRDAGGVMGRMEGVAFEEDRVAESVAQVILLVERYRHFILVVLEQLVEMKIYFRFNLNKLQSMIDIPVNFDSNFNYFIWQGEDILKRAIRNFQKFMKSPINSFFGY